MPSILASDVLIADVIADVEGNPQLEALIQKHGLVPGGKRAMDETQFHAFSAAVAGCPITLVPGGSTANMLVTLNHLFDHTLDITFVGVAGQGLSSQMIRQSLEEAHITLLPEKLPPEPTPKTAMSYVLRFADGQRTIATYPGNARALLTPGIMTDALVQQQDIVLMPGALGMKIGQEYADRLLTLAMKHKKELWLALPTYSMPGNTSPERFCDMIPHATLILGNEEEVARLFGDVQTLQQALNDMQTAFVTSGEHGAMVVTRSEMLTVPLYEGGARAIVNTLGAGDAAFAGFAYGYLKKLPLQDSARIGMALAAAKLAINGARVPNPKQYLPQ